MDRSNPRLDFIEAEVVGKLKIKLSYQAKMLSETKV